MRRRLAHEEKIIKNYKEETSTQNQAGTSRSGSSQGRRADLLEDEGQFIGSFPSGEDLKQ